MKFGKMVQCKIAIATNSLGKSAAGHDIIHKLRVAKAHGFEGVEVAIECLEAHAANFPGEHRASRLRAAANDVFLVASGLSLSIIALNPFGAYDGLTNPLDIDSRLEEAELWLQLCLLMRAPFFQVLYLPFA
jgi:4-hydroxyphenylpyruvate dioxygenase